MKRIVRLTENDLTRIVKRVLEEAPTDVIKVKVFNSPDDPKKGYQRACNIQAKNLKVVGSQIHFDYTIPGGTKCSLGHYGEYTSGEIKNSGTARINCGDNRGYTIMFQGNKTIFGYLSKEGYAKLSYLCDEYASVEDDDMEDDDMMDDDFV